MAFNPALPEEKKKRAAMLKAQGWSTADVAKDTGILAATITANWRGWANQYGVQLPAKRSAEQPAGSSNMVTSYKVDPVTGEQLTEPVTEAVELSTKSMPSDFSAAPIEDIDQQVAQSPKKPVSEAEPELSEAPALEPPAEPQPKKSFAERFAQQVPLQQDLPPDLPHRVYKINGVHMETVVAIAAVKKEPQSGLFYEATEFWTVDGRYIGDI